MSKDIKGVLGTKLGMTQVFSDNGKIVPVTVVEAGPCVVTAVRTACATPSRAAAAATVCAATCVLTQTRTVRIGLLSSRFNI